MAAPDKVRTGRVGFCQKSPYALCVLYNESLRPLSRLEERGGVVLVVRSGRVPMHPPLRVQERVRHLARLEQMYHQTDNPRTPLRVQMVLLSHEGCSVEDAGLLKAMVPCGTGTIAFRRPVALA